MLRPGLGHERLRAPGHQPARNRACPQSRAYEHYRVSHPRSRLPLAHRGDWTVARVRQDGANSSSLGRFAWQPFHDAARLKTPQASARSEPARQGYCRSIMLRARRRNSRSQGTGRTRLPQPWVGVLLKRFLPNGLSRHRGTSETHAAGPASLAFRSNLRSKWTSYRAGASNSGAAYAVPIAWFRMAQRCSSSATGPSYHRSQCRSIHAQRASGVGHKSSHHQAVPSGTPAKKPACPRAMRPRHAHNTNLLRD